MAVKAIIFDIDGVLADSREAIAHNTICLMKEFGFDVPASRVESMSSAHSAESVLVALAPSLSADSALLKKMLARLAALTKENMMMVKPSPLAVNVPALAARYRLAAASNRKSSAHLVLKVLGIEKYFEVVMTSEEMPAKPDPTTIKFLWWPPTSAKPKSAGERALPNRKPSFPRQKTRLKRTNIRFLFLQRNQNKCT